MSDKADRKRESIGQDSSPEAIKSKIKAIRIRHLKLTELLAKVSKELSKKDCDTVGVWSLLNEARTKFQHDPRDLEQLQRMWLEAYSRITHAKIEYARTMHTTLSQLNQVSERYSLCIDKLTELLTLIHQVKQPSGLRGLQAQLSQEKSNIPQIEVKLAAANTKLQGTTQAKDRGRLHAKIRRLNNTKAIAEMAVDILSSHDRARRMSQPPAEVPVKLDEKVAAAAVPVAAPVAVAVPAEVDKDALVAESKSKPPVSPTSGISGVFNFAEEAVEQEIPEEIIKQQDKQTTAIEGNVAVAKRALQRFQKGKLEATKALQEIQKIEGQIENISFPEGLHVPKEITREVTGYKLIQLSVIAGYKEEIQAKLLLQQRMLAVRSIYTRFEQSKLPAAQALAEVQAISEAMKTERIHDSISYSAQQEIQKQQQELALLLSKNMRTIREKLSEKTLASTVRSSREILSKLSKGKSAKDAKSASQPAEQITVLSQQCNAIKDELTPLLAAVKKRQEDFSTPTLEQGMELLALLDLIQKRCEEIEPLLIALKEGNKVSRVFNSQQRQLTNLCDKFAGFKDFWVGELTRPLRLWVPAAINAIEARYANTQQVPDMVTAERVACIRALLDMASKLEVTEPQIITLLQIQLEAAMVCFTTLKADPDNENSYDRQVKRALIAGEKAVTAERERQAQKFNTAPAGVELSADVAGVKADAKSKPDARKLSVPGLAVRSDAIHVGAALAAATAPDRSPEPEEPSTPDIVDLDDLMKIK